ncbi:HAMP domain-containing sensor histidine kinase, partial [Anaerolinea sp.]
LVEAVNVLAERLKNLESARRQLLANLVHELGRPLGALRSAVQALLNGAVNDHVLSGELLNGMENELVRLQSLLGELTHLYDQVLGDLELERKPVDLKAWLGELIAPWQVNAAEQGVRWETVIPDELPSLSIDPVRMGQALGNLLSNAVKFTPAGGLIRLEVSQTPAEVRICVRDTGAGIPPDELEKIFTPFYRGTQGKRFVEGMGLGLSIARDVVKAHGGRIDVESIVGQGSAFTIVLPLQG